MSLYLLTFFRFVIGFVFAISLVGKVRDIPAFTQAITNFQFFPQGFSKPLAYLFLLGELGTVVAMLIDGVFLIWGFWIATLMFFAFSIALSSVVLRKIHTSCNCFGPDNKDITSGHVIRSLGFMACGIGGAIIIDSYRTSLEPLSLLHIAFVGMLAIVFVEVWMQIDDILQLLIPLRI